MKHARPTALNQFADLLDALRSLPGLIEKTRGVFYRGSVAFLHFHESAAGVLADLRTPFGWKRFALAETDDQRTVFSIARTLAGSAMNSTPSTKPKVAQVSRLC